MFFEKAAAFDFYHNMKNRHDYHCFLVTGQIEKIQQLNQNQFIILTIKWKKKVKEILQNDDIGIILNNGNVLAFIHKDRSQTFQDDISSISIDKNDVSIMKTDIMQLKENETRAIMIS